jgi:methylated-DNA-[protein]-cysteine S-methyltransferase
MTLELFIDRVPSPLGPLVLVHDREGRLYALDFRDDEARVRRLLSRHHGEGTWTLAAGHAPCRIRTPIDAFFAGELDAIDAIAVRTGGTEFQRRMWAALRRIPAGTTTTYGRLASLIGRPGASRAVGLANSANPIGIVVPCHRVIGADGTLTGYGGGLERKRWLLDHERTWCGAERGLPTAAGAGATRA